MSKDLSADIEVIKNELRNIAETLRRLESTLCDDSKRINNLERLSAEQNQKIKNIGSLNAILSIVSGVVATIIKPSN